MKVMSLRTWKSLHNMNSTFNLWSAQVSHLSTHYHTLFVLKTLNGGLVVSISSAHWEQVENTPWAALQSITRYHSLSRWHLGVVYNAHQHACFFSVGGKRKWREWNMADGMGGGTVFATIQQKKVTSSNPGWGSFCIDFVCICMVFLC